MGRISSIILSVPRTIYFNFSYLPFKKAIHLPIWIANNVRIRNLHKGSIILNNSSIKLGMIRIGYHKVEAVDIYSAHTVMDVKKSGKIVFKNDAHIGHGAILSVKEHGVLTLGANFAISGTTSIVCYNNISIGNNVQFSWDSLVIDSDAHHVIDESGNYTANTRPIIIGNNVWIGTRTTILKGTAVNDNCVIGSASLLNKQYPSPNMLIAGSPAREIRKITGWKL